LVSDITTIERDDLQYLVGKDALPDNLYVTALDFFRNAKSWNKWALGALLALGVGHVLAGVIFFFAYNWNDLADMTKFAIIGGAMVSSIIAWIVLKLDSAPAQAFGIISTVLFGVFLAVFGQVYQTPTTIYAPFVLWAVLTLPFAAASKSRAHWAVWIAIFIVAVTSYVNAGVRPMRSDVFANGLHVGLGAGFALLVAAYDKLITLAKGIKSPDWFRLYLIAISGAFAFAGFTEAFWDNHGASKTLLWLASIGVALGLLAYLYRSRKSLASMALAGFALVTLVGQFSFKLFETGMDDTLVFLLNAVWMGGVTVALAKLFQFFIARMKSVAPQAGRQNASVKPENGADDIVFQISEFSSKMGLKADNIQSAITASPHKKSPWYLDLFLALSGIVAAILAGGFLGLLLSQVLGIENEIAMIALGLLVYVLTVFLRRKTRNMFARHFLNTLILAGGALALVGVGILTDGKLPFILIGIALSGLTMYLVRDRIVEFLMALGIVGLFIYGLYDYNLPMPHVFVMLFCTVLGVIGLTQPIRDRVYNAAGAAFLLAPCVYAIFTTDFSAFGVKADILTWELWTSRIFGWLILIAAVYMLNKANKKSMKFRPPLAALIPLLAAAAILPIGSAAALLAILAGYILGSRALAIVGVLFQIYFLYMFYYDLGISLLNKSILLFVSGLIFIGVWAYFRKAKPGVTS
jgi:uncharacterized membrane protein